MSVTQDTGNGKAKGTGAAKPAANPNMRIWDAVSVTPPSWTKRVQETKKSRPYTTVNAYRQIAAATRQFGPLGEGWGYDYELEYRGEGADELVFCHLTLWHGKREQTIPVTTAKRTHMGRGEDAWLDEDFPKKALTDAITKALSYLGFSSDVFYGLYDDNKYVAEQMHNEHAAAEPAKTADSVSAAKQRLAVMLRTRGIDLSLVKDALQAEYGASSLEELHDEARARFIQRVERVCAALGEVQTICDKFALGGGPKWKAADALADWMKRHLDTANPLLATEGNIHSFMCDLGESAARDKAQVDEEA